MTDEKTKPWNWANAHFPNIEPCDSSGDYEETSVAKQVFKAFGVDE